MLSRSSRRVREPTPVEGCGVESNSRALGLDLIATVNLTARRRVSYEFPLNSRNGGTLRPTS
jgi:hypothetical protein